MKTLRHLPLFHFTPPPPPPVPSTGCSSVLFRQHPSDSTRDSYHRKRHVSLIDQPVISARSGLVLSQCSHHCDIDLCRGQAAVSRTFLKVKPSQAGLYSQFNSVPRGIYAVGKIHMRFAPSLRRFSQRCR